MSRFPLILNDEKKSNLPYLYLRRIHHSQIILMHVSKDLQFSASLSSQIISCHLEVLMSFWFFKNQYFSAYLCKQLQKISRKNAFLFTSALIIDLFSRYWFQNVINLAII